MKVRTSSPTRSFSGWAIAARFPSCAPLCPRPRRIGKQLALEVGEHRVAGRVELAPQPFKQMAAPFDEIDDAWRQPLRVEAQPQHVDRRLKQLGIGDVGKQRRDCRVGVNHVPVRSTAMAGFGSWPLSTSRTASTGGCKRRIVELALAIAWRETGGEQQVVAFPERYFELVGEVKHHVARRFGAAAFQKAQMALRDFGLAGEVELAHAPPDAPFAQQRTGRIFGHQHASDDRRSGKSHLLPAT